MKLINKIAFITGAGSGIGAQAALLFASEGACVMIVERNAESGRTVEQEILRRGGQARFIECDVTNEASVKNAVDVVIANYGEIDILYNNVGGSTPHDGPLTTVSLDEFWRAIQIDLFGTFLPSRYVIPSLIRKGGGSVINTSSYVALVGTAGRDCYTAAKGAILSLTRSMAVEFGPHNIRVNAIAPGAVNTERLRNFLANAPDHPTFDPRNRHRRPEVASHLMGLVEPEDVAQTALFLASDDSKKITGHIMKVDSGATAW